MKRQGKKNATIILDISSYTRKAGNGISETKVMFSIHFKTNVSTSNRIDFIKSIFMFKEQVLGMIIQKAIAYINNLLL